MFNGKPRSWPDRCRSIADHLPAPNIMAPQQHLAHFVLLAVVMAAFVSLVAAFSVQDVATAVLSPDNLQKYKFELVGLAVVVLYMIVMWRGTAHIKQLARAWVRYAACAGAAAVCQGRSVQVHMSAAPEYYCRSRSSCQTFVRHLI